MLLMEVAYTPDTVPEDVTFKLVVKQGGLFSTITASTGEGSSLIGGVRAARALSDRSEEPCFDGFEVALSNAAQGLGPLLYDIVMEVASEIGGGLYSDRSEVSREARNIWNYYDRNCNNRNSNSRNSNSNNFYTRSYTSPSNNGGFKEITIKCSRAN